MPRKKSLAFRREQAKKVQEGLRKRYPQPETHLHHETPWQLLVATVLSAQCTDARVNMVTPVLFAKWKDAFALAKADVKDVEEVIKSTGFYHNKAKNLVAGAKFLVENYNGEVPKTMAELVKVAGVARKTANVVLCTAYGIFSFVMIKALLYWNYRHMPLTLCLMCFKVGNPQKYNAFWSTLVILFLFMSTRQASNDIILYLENKSKYLT